jgi:hypothetical protein
VGEKDPIAFLLGNGSGDSVQTLRRWHLYLGCFFSPLLIYFTVSGAWQLFRYNNIPKGQQPTALNSALHEASKPHTGATLPGEDPRAAKSVCFNFFALLMALGMVTTSVIGILLALKMSRRRSVAVICLVLGTLFPIALLFVRSGH